MTQHSCHTLLHMDTGIQEYRIKDLRHYLSLWEGVHSSNRGQCWNHFLPYYDENIIFKDSIQEIKGISDFTKMVERLSKRSTALEVKVHNSCMEGNLIFVEWEMIMTYKKYPKTSLFGLSRVTLNEGKIVEQRDYYDLWGDILDNVKFLAKGYRKLMKRWFG